MISKEQTTISKAAENLANFAFSREDVKQIINTIPDELPVNRVTIEYELQILKIISVGWGITFFLENFSYKTPMAELFWNFIKEFSKDLSVAASTTTGKDIDYFNIVKKRLDMYVTAMNKNSEAPEPAVVVGPEFAAICGHQDEVFTVMAGSKLFLLTIGNVKEYLESVTVDYN